MPMRREDEVTEAVLSRPGRYRQVAENLEVKEVIVGDGERRRRYAVCFNPIEDKRQTGTSGKTPQGTGGETGQPVRAGESESQQTCLRATHQPSLWALAERNGAGTGDRPIGGERTGTFRRQVRGA